MTKFLTILTSAILALLLITFGLLLVRGKPVPVSVAKDTADEAAIAPPESLASVPSPSPVEKPESEEEASAVSSDEEAATSIDDAAPPVVDVSSGPPIGNSIPLRTDHPVNVDTTDLESVPRDRAVNEGDLALQSTDQPPRAYTVRDGDNLASISRRLYGDAGLWKAIADTNPSVNPATLRVGQTLQLPAASSLAAKQTPQEPFGTGPVIHKVRSGDSLYSIARKYYGNPVTWKRIRDANPEALEKGVRQLQVGRQLTIPPLNDH